MEKSFDYSAFAPPPDTRALASLIAQVRDAQGEYHRWLVEDAIPDEMLRRGVLSFGGYRFREHNLAWPRAGRESDAARWLASRGFVSPTRRRARARARGEFLAQHRRGHGAPPCELFEFDIAWEARRT